MTFLFTYSIDGLITVIGWVFDRDWIGGRWNIGKLVTGVGDISKPLIYEPLLLCLECLGNISIIINHLNLLLIYS